MGKFIRNWQKNEKKLKKGKIKKCDADNISDADPEEV